MKKKKLMIFPTSWKIMNWHFLEYFSYFSDFSYLFLDLKLQPLGVGLKRPKTIKMDLILRAVTFDPRKIWKIWMHIWNQRGSNILNCQFIIFQPVEKNLHFFVLHFSSSFSIFSKKFFILNFSWARISECMYVCMCVCPRTLGKPRKRNN